MQSNLFPFDVSSPSPSARPPQGVSERSGPERRAAEEPRTETETETDKQLHLSLAAFNRRRLSPALPSREWIDDLVDELVLARREGAFVEQERTEPEVMAALANLPTDAPGFLAWLTALELHGPGQHDPLFPWLAQQANVEALRWFLRQEVAGEAGFEDLVALTQVKLPARPKLEMARNYWDELGRGHESAMHGPLLGRLAEALDVATTPPEEIVVESLALGNLMSAFACNRRYAYQSIGALGAIELTAPGRAHHVFQGLKRLGFGDVGHYFAIHATLDVKHSRAWNAEIIGPLVADRPELARPIAEGAWLRLEHGRRCFDRYRRELVNAGLANRADFDRRVAA
jgi:hypothetical protein